jgi:hypothetical protein
VASDATELLTHKLSGSAERCFDIFISAVAQAIYQYAHAPGP